MKLKELDNVISELRKDEAEEKKIEGLAHQWIHDNYLMYRGDNATDCMVAAYIAGYKK